MIDGPRDIQAGWFIGIETVGLTAGASAPEVLVSDVLAHLKSLGADVIEEQSGEAETVVFPLPKTLRA